MKPLDTVLQAVAVAKGWIPSKKNDSLGVYWFREEVGSDPIAVVIDLDFCNEVLSLEKEVECPHCYGTGSKSIPTGIHHEVVECPRCKGTGKIMVPLIDRERYLEALYNILPIETITKNQYENLTLLDAILVRDSLAIHTATVEKRIEALAKTIEETK